MCSAKVEPKDVKSWGRRKASDLVKNKLSSFPEKAQDFQMVWTKTLPAMEGQP